MFGHPPDGQVNSRRIRDNLFCEALPRGTIGGMDKTEQAPLWKVIIGAIVFISIFVLPIWTEWIIVLAYGSPILGALFIWEIVRQINRRDDPRHAKRPPDPP